MRTLFERIGIAVLTVIPVTSMLLLFEIVTFPNSHRWKGSVLAAYMALVLVLLLREAVLKLLGCRSRR